MIITQKRIYRSDLRANRTVLYVFGDNLDRVGYGGQTKECRGEPNAIGLVTKRHPTFDEAAFFTDEDLELVKRANLVDVHKLMRCSLVVWPEDGIGTGLAELATRAPKIKAYYDGLQRSINLARFT